MTTYKIKISSQKYFTFAKINFKYLGFKNPFCYIQRIPIYFSSSRYPYFRDLFLLVLLLGLLVFVLLLFHYKYLLEVASEQSKWKTICVVLLDTIVSVRKKYWKVRMQKRRVRFKFIQVRQKLNQRHTTITKKFNLLKVFSDHSLCKVLVYMKCCSNAYIVGIDEDFPIFIIALKLWIEMDKLTWLQSIQLTPTTTL